MAVMTVTPRAQEDGETAFKAACARCHSVKAVEIEATVSGRIRGPDLSTVEPDHDAAWIVSVVKQETKLSGRQHRPPFRGTDDQLDAIAAWLVGLE